MPVITPMDESGQMTINQTTQMPSAKLQVAPEPTPAVEATPSTPMEPLTPPAPEQKSIPTPSEVKEDVDPERFRSLLRKEREIVNRDKQILAREKALQEREAKLQKWEKAAELAPHNPLEASKMVDLDYNKLTEQILNNGNLPVDVIAERKAQEIFDRKMADFEAKLAKRDEERQQAQYQQMKTQMESQIKRATEQSDKFPLVKETESYQDVSKLIEDEFHRTGELMPVEVALERWESEIAEGLSVLANNERIRARLFQKKEEAPKVEPPRERVPEPQQKITTLTHKAATQAVSPPAMTDSERRQRAIDAFYGRLN